MFAFGTTSKGQANRTVKIEVYGKSIERGATGIIIERRVLLGTMEVPATGDIADRVKGFYPNATHTALAW